MESSQELESGNFKIAGGVLELISGIAVLEVEGVSDLSGSTMDNIVGLLGKKSLTKGIKVTAEDRVLSIDVHVTARYTYALHDMARQIQENVKHIVEAMTGLSVRAVNVFIDNVIFTSVEEEESPSK